MDQTAITAETPRGLRLVREMTLDDVVARARSLGYHIDRSELSRFENGVHQRDNYVAALAAVFGVTEDWIRSSARRSA